MKGASLTVYRGCTPVVDATYGRDTEQTPTEAVVDALAEAADVDPLDLSPLYDEIDTEAIDRLFQEHGGASSSEAILSFQVDKWNVFIRGDGRIRVCDGARPTDPEPVF